MDVVIRRRAFYAKQGSAGSAVVATTQTTANPVEPKSISGTQPDYAFFGFSLVVHQSFKQPMGITKTPSSRL